MYVHTIIQNMALSSRAIRVTCSDNGLSRTLSVPYLVFYLFSTNPLIKIKLFD